MTIIVFLIDNSVSMNQRTYQGTTLLDASKAAVELFFKMRMAKSRVDRYFILTLDHEPNYIKLAGWKQNVDMNCIHLSLNNIKPDGQTPLVLGLQRTFRLLNLNRLQLGLENYGMGLLPSLSEPAVIICITDGCVVGKLDDAVLKDLSLSSIECGVVGQPLTNNLYRWDYRLYTVVLNYPAFVESSYIEPTTRLTPKSNPLTLVAENTGGNAYSVANLRDLNQCLESLVSKCQPGVVLDVELEKIEGDTTAIGQVSTSYKQLIHVKSMGRVFSNWPIPESFWPDDDLLPQLPPRSAHPKLVVSNTQVHPVSVPENFVDRYELEVSPFTKHLSNGDPSLVWQCFDKNSHLGSKAPFGYLSLSTDSQCVHLHILPYNYPVFLQLLNELYHVHHMRMSESWGNQFVSYLGSIPRYYFLPLTKAFEKIGFQGVIKPEALDRVLPYQVKHLLQKLRIISKLEYDNFVRMVQVTDCSIQTLKIPPSLIPQPLWAYREMRPNCNHSAQLSMCQVRCRPNDIDRKHLRKSLWRMKQQLDRLLDGKLTLDQNYPAHQQPVSEMGDYVNYKGTASREQPLREVSPSPERLDTFGNPFKKKSINFFMADEVFVDEMGLSIPMTGPNAALVSPSRKKTPVSAARTKIKGSLQPHNNHVHLREALYKRPASPKDHISVSVSNKLLTESKIDSPPVKSSYSISGVKPFIKTITSKEAFVQNKDVIRDLTLLVRQPYVGFPDLFRRLNDLSGTNGQRQAAVSVVMSEALRFRRVNLYCLLNDWRTWISSNGARSCSLGKDPSAKRHCSTVELTVNGWV